MDSGYVELGKKKMEFSRKGITVMTENVFTPHTEPQAEPAVAPQPGTAQKASAEEPETFVYLGADRW